MWAGGASTLEAAVLAAYPFNFSRHGDNRDGLRLAAVPVLYRRQPDGVVVNALAWEEDSLTIEIQAPSEIVARVWRVWYIAKIVRFGSMAKRLCGKSERK